MASNNFQIILTMKTAFVLPVVALFTIQAAAQTPRSRQEPTASTETYESVDIDVDQNLRILTSEQRTLIVPKGGSSKVGESFGKQTAFEKPVLSDDHRAVGAQAMFANCCTSYDPFPCNSSSIRVSKAHRFEGGLAIFDWHFADGGRRVVFSQQTVELHLLASLGTERHRKRASSSKPRRTYRKGAERFQKLTEGEGAELGYGNRLGVQMTAQQVLYEEKGVFVLFVLQFAVSVGEEDRSFEPRAHKIQTSRPPSQPPAPTAVRAGGQVLHQIGCTQSGEQPNFLWGTIYQ